MHFVVLIFGKRGGAREGADGVGNGCRGWRGQLVHGVGDWQSAWQVSSRETRSLSGWSGRPGRENELSPLLDLYLYPTV